VSDIFLLASKIIEKLKPLGNSNEEDKESNEPDYDEDKDQLEEEQEDKNPRNKINFKSSFLNIQT
jgi:hypothetical protein